jgi:2-polyprenyl-6-methoxyphenol hydroxylase-like FAD-dependent oxidoreductase
MNPVLIVGAGPVGLTMALDLARRGIRPRIIDRALQPSPFCRAIGVTPRTLEVWESMGVASDMIDAGLWLTGTRSVINHGPAEDFVNPRLGLPYAPLGIPQYATELILAQHLSRFGVEIERGLELTTLEQDDRACHVTLSNADRQQHTASFRYVIGCDGAHSAVRKQLGIAFEGEAYPWSFMLGDVEVGLELPYGMGMRALRLNAGGPPDMFIAIPLPERGRYRVSMLASADAVQNTGTEHGIQAELAGPSLSHLQAIADSLLPDKPVLSDLRWSSVFRISMRLAAHYRAGHVFIAGDAAHIHPPTGGQGMNTGIQDAHNLAWKLALVLAGKMNENQLESYEAERRPVGQAVLASTRRASENIGRQRMTAESRLADAQVTISYRDSDWVHENAVGAAGPVAGDRAPDVNGLVAEGIGFPVRLFNVLDGIRHVLLAHLDSAEETRLAELAAYARKLGDNARVVVVSPEYIAPRAGLRMLHDEKRAFAASYGSDARLFLVRPDGHIGWRTRDIPGCADRLIM